MPKALGYKIKKIDNRAFYLVNGEWVTRGRVPEHRAKQKKYHLENRERDNKRGRETYWRNPEKQRLLSSTWRKNNIKRVREYSCNYNNTERGKIIEVIAGIFARHRKKDSRKKWIPEIDKKGIWLIVMNHICRMKEQFPGSDGRLCFFCKKPWTYIRRPSNGTGKKGPVILTNFSLDRLDCTKTYKEGNIVCCCIGCNDRKGSSTPEDWRIYIEAEKELKRINEME